MEHFDIEVEGGDEKLPFDRQVEAIIDRYSTTYFSRMKAVAEAYKLGYEGDKLTFKECCDWTSMGLYMYLERELARGMIDGIELDWVGVLTASPSGEGTQTFLRVGENEVEEDFKIGEGGNANAYYVNCLHYDKSKGIFIAIPEPQILCDYTVPDRKIRVVKSVPTQFERRLYRLGCPANMRAYLSGETDELPLPINRGRRSHLM